MFDNNKLMQVQEVREIVSTTDATVQGILLGVAVALGLAVIYLYRENNKMQKEMREELKNFTELLIKQNNSYQEFVNFMKNNKNV